MPYPHVHAARLKSPKSFQEIVGQKEIAPGVHAIFGKKSNGKTEIQTIHFDAAKFTAAEAKAWLKSHHFHPISFEPATGGKK